MLINILVTSSWYFFGILRVKLLSLIENHPDRIDLQVVTANIIARLIRTRYNVSKD